DIGAVARKGYGQVVDAEICGQSDVGTVLVGERPGRQPPTLLVDALVVGKLPAHHHARLDARADYAIHLQHDLSIVEQQGVARPHVVRQVLVGHADCRGRAAVWIERDV